MSDEFFVGSGLGFAAGVVLVVALVLSFSAGEAEAEAEAPAKCFERWTDIPGVTLDTPLDQIPRLAQKFERCAD